MFGKLFWIMQNVGPFFFRWLFWGIVFSWLVCQWLQNGVTSYDFFYLYFMCEGEWKSVFEKHAFYVQK